MHTESKSCGAGQRGENIISKVSRGEAVRNAWIAKIKREEFVVSRHSKICSLNFTKESFQRSPDMANSIELMLKAELLPDAVPTIFVYSRVEKRTCSARKKRMHSEESFSNNTIISL